jgi:hypothetical protein
LKHSGFNNQIGNADEVLTQGVEFKLWVKNVTDEDINTDPTHYENTQTLVGMQYPGREYGLTASYTF